MCSGRGVFFLSNSDERTSTSRRCEGGEEEGGVGLPLEEAGEAGGGGTEAEEGEGGGAEAGVEGEGGGINPLQRYPTVVEFHVFLSQERECSVHKINCMLTARVVRGVPSIPSSIYGLYHVLPKGSL